MSTFLELETTPASPLSQRVVQSRIVSASEAELEAERVFFGSRSKKSLAKVAGGLLIALIFSLQFFNAHNPDKLIQYKLVGGTLMLIVVGGMALVIYEWRRKYRVFVLDEEFAVERRFSQEVELFKWSDIAKVYCLDRTTTTRLYVSIIPVGSATHHEGKIRIVLVDGRQIVLTKDVYGFSELAYQITCRTTAAQLVTCTKFVLESNGTLDFDKFRMTSDGLVVKRKLLDWGDIQQVSQSQRGILKFCTKKLWWSPRFAIAAIPNAMLLLEMVRMFGVECVQEG